MDDAELEPAIQALMSSDFGARTRAGVVGWLMTELDRRRHDPPVPPLVVRLLGHLKEPQAVEPLLELLDDDDVAEQVATALGTIGDRRAVEPLITIVQIPEGSDKNALRPAHVRRAAIYALGEIGDRRAVGPMIQAASTYYTSYMYYEHDRDDLFLLSETIVALGKLRDARAVRWLLTRDWPTHEGVLASVATALGRIGDMRAYWQLVLLSRSSGVMDDVWDVTEAAKPALQELLDQNRNVYSLLWPLTSCDDRPEVNAPAREALLSCIPETETVEPLLEALRYRDFEVKAAAADALARLGGRAVKPLTGIVLDATTQRDTRVAAAVALGKIGQPFAIEALAGAIRSGEAVLEAIRRIDRVDAARVLIAIVSGGARARRIAWVQALAGLAPDLAVEPLLAAFADHDWRVRLAAAQALGELGDAESVDALGHMAEHQLERLCVRDAARHALKRIRRNATACQSATSTIEPGCAS